MQLMKSKSAKHYALFLSNWRHFENNVTFYSINENAHTPVVLMEGTNNISFIVRKPTLKATN